MALRKNLGILICGLMVLGCARSASQEDSVAAPVSYGYRVDPSWPKKPAGIEWGGMPGIALVAIPRAILLAAVDTEPGRR